MNHSKEESKKPQASSVRQQAVDNLKKDFDIQDYPGIKNIERNNYE
jgi:hypothetical protein